ncbi:MAG: hypothetical protein CSYNP_03535 [Syntrophus sp. SKADARSKE-3]|nr:hypothetical protein [Syntrophus sp. SKADARSKE-3]
MDNSLSKEFWDEIGKTAGLMLNENSKEIEALYLKADVVPITVSIKIGKDKLTKVTVKCTTGKVNVEKTFTPGQGNLGI